MDVVTHNERPEIFLPSVEMIKDSQNIQNEIKNLLSQAIQIFQVTKSKRNCSKRKIDLVDFVCNDFDDNPKENKQQDNAEKHLQGQVDRRNLDSDSIVVGTISPHREANESLSSSKSPPSVPKLSFQENIDRLFASEPKSYSYGSDEFNRNEKPSIIDHSQVNSSEYGTRSDNTCASKCKQYTSVASKNYEINEHQHRIGSSKCNMLTLSTCQSRFNKDFKKDANNNEPSVNQTGSFKRMWENGSPNHRVVRPEFEESPSSCTQNFTFQLVPKRDKKCEKDKSSSVANKVELTPEIVYRYQMPVPNLNDILMRDREILKSMKQPDLVNQQLSMLQEERKDENENMLKADTDDFYVTEDLMLGLATDHNINDELDYREECLLQLMCED